MSKFTHGEARGIRRLPHRWERAVDASEDFFEVYEYARVQHFLFTCICYNERTRIVGWGLGRQK